LNPRIALVDDIAEQASGLGVDGEGLRLENHLDNTVQNSKNQVNNCQPRDSDTVPLHVA
jgi:hypothetical protein